MKAVWPRDVP